MASYWLLPLPGPNFTRLILWNTVVDMQPVQTHLGGTVCPTLPQTSFVLRESKWASVCLPCSVHQIKAPTSNVLISTYHTVNVQQTKLLLCSHCVLTTCSFVVILRSAWGIVLQQIIWAKYYSYLTRAETIRRTMTTTTRKTMIIMMWNAQINEHEAVFITHGKHRSLGLYAARLQF